MRQRLARARPGDGVVSVRAVCGDSGGALVASVAASERVTLHRDAARARWQLIAQQVCASASEMSALAR